MKFKSNALPIPSIGISFKGVKDQVVPDQSLSLREILERFTRGESLPIHHEPSEGIQDVDLEKIRHADLVEQHEFIDSLKEVQVKYDSQEREKAAKLAAEKKARVAAKKKKAEENSAPGSGLP